MSERPDAAALQNASAVLRRLTQLVEDGTLAATEETQLVAASYWHGAADALSTAADGDS